MLYMHHPIYGDTKTFFCIKFAKLLAKARREKHFIGWRFNCGIISLSGNFAVFGKIRF